MPLNPTFCFFKSPVSPNAANNFHNPLDLTTEMQNLPVCQPEDVAPVDQLRDTWTFENAEFYLDWKGKLEVFVAQSALDISQYFISSSVPKTKASRLTFWQRTDSIFLCLIVQRRLKKFEVLPFVLLPHRTLLRRPAVSPSVCSFESHIFSRYIFEGTRRSRCVEILRSILVCSFVQLGA